MELIIQYIVFGVWPLLISLTVLRTIRVVICIRSCVCVCVCVCVCTHVHFIADKHFTAWTYHIYLSIH